MYLLVEYNNNYTELIKECEKYKIIPITLFKLKLNGKENIKKQLEQIRKSKKQSCAKHSAIQVTVEKQENSSQGTINSLKEEFDLVIGLGGLNKTNRFFLEDTNIDFLESPENTFFQSKSDFIHHPNTGLNQILCTFAKEKDIALYFNLNVLQKHSNSKVKDFGRINANLKLARKYKVQSLLSQTISNKSQIKPIKQMEILPHLFDLSTEQIKESNNLLEKKLKENKEKKSDKYIREGIRVE